MSIADLYYQRTQFKYYEKIRPQLFSPYLHCIFSVIYTGNNFICNINNMLIAIMNISKLPKWMGAPEDDVSVDYRTFYIYTTFNLNKVNPSDLAVNFFNIWSYLY
jgi:hypothetical protein